MSAAFALVPSGPPAPCGYPGCVLHDYHDGDHEIVRKPLSVQESYDRLLAAQTPYGAGTRSYNRSAAKREIDRQCTAATAAYVAETRILEWGLCPCRQRSYAHDPSVHKQLRGEAFNPRLRNQWPWSLCFSDRLELSTER